MAIGLDLATCDKLLSTTRSVRLRLDLERPVEPELIEQCIEMAIQAPSPKNLQKWHFIVVTDEQKRALLADIYRRSFERYWAAARAENPQTFDEPSAPLQRMIDSANYLTMHLHEVPVHVLFCTEGELVNASLFDQASEYGSILPAAWSFMLAARARGLGSCWTTVHLFDAGAAAELLGMPGGLTQTVLLPVAYYKGDDFRPAPRRPLAEVVHWNGWRGRR